MLLAIDIGNANIHFGLFDGLELVRAAAVPTSTPDIFSETVGEAAITKIVLASVAPSVTERLVPLLATHYGMPPLVVGRDLPYGIEIQCDVPEKVGADRVINAIAAYERTGCATIIADIGSAVTVDLVSDRGSFCGGAIAPGPGLMLRALHQNTELLPEANLSEPPLSLGRNTNSAIEAGVYWGTAGLVERLITQIAEDHAPESPILVTGGAGEWVAPLLNLKVEHVAHLTLEGLAVLAQRS